MEDNLKSCSPMFKNKDSGPCIYIILNGRLDITEAVYNQIMDKGIIKKSIIYVYIDI